MEKFTAKLPLSYSKCCFVIKVYTIFFSLTFSNLLFATNYYVNDNSTLGDVFTAAVGDNTNNGTDPSTPKATLTNVWTTYGPSGTNVLTAGDVIYVDVGTYTSTDRDLNITVAGLVITGAGTALTIFDNGSSADHHFMRISAAITLNDFKIFRYTKNGTYAHAIHVHTTVTNVELNSIQIDNCGFTGGMYPIEIESGASVTFNGGGTTCNSSWILSGGIHVVGATTVVVINDYTFFNNSRDENGVCLQRVNGTVTINNSIFEENVKYGEPAGLIYQSAGSLSINDCIFNNNTIRGPAEGTIYGGVIALRGGTFTMKKSRITNSTRPATPGATIAGGAIGILGGTVTATIDSCYFSANEGNSSRGSDIHARGSNATLTAIDCTFGSASSQVGTSSSGTITMSFSGDPGVYTNTGSTTKTNTDSPRYTANPSLGLYTGDCAEGVILPVELTSFYAFCLHNNINITWQTASEKNNDYFLLERSKNGYDFERVVIIQGAGNTQLEQEYQFSDYDFLPGTSYYRLTQVDFDGESETFDIISVQNDCVDDENLRAHYNKEAGTIRLFHQFEEQDVLSLAVYSVSGQRVPVTHANWDKNLGYSEIIPFTEFAKGIYIITLQTLSEVKTAKIIIQ